MITMAIIGILAGIAVPGFFRWLPDYYLKSAARDLFSNMQLTRVGAIKGGTDWAIVFDTANDRYLVCSGKGADGSWCTDDVNGNPTEVKIVYLTGDLSAYKTGDIDFGHGDATTNATSSGGGFPDDGETFNTAATFNSRGMGNPGYVYMDNKNNKAYAVGKLRTGSIRCVRWAGAEWK